MTDQTAADSTTLIELDLWSDLVCPYSWVAKRRLQAAVGAFERPHDVTVRLRSFELYPDVPVGGGVPVREHLSIRHGGDAGTRRLINAKASEAAPADDPVFDPDPAGRAQHVCAPPLR